MRPRRAPPPPRSHRSTRAASTPVGCIVVLDQDPLATYRGGLPNLARTAPLGTDDIDLDTAAADAYAAHLESEQAQVASAIGAQVASSLTVTMNGFIADLSAEQALELARDARVSQIFPDEIQQIQASPANEFLDLEGLWNQVGGVDAAGEGVVVGVLDTGIAPENPLFAGDPLGVVPGAEPYVNAEGEIVYTKGDGSTFTGVCQTGEQFEAADCSTKIVSARYYVEGFGEENIGTETQVPGEYLSPRDGDAHGSHTASTAAGNADVPVTSPGGADLGTMSGVAPEARIAAYKVCWSGPDPASRDDDGCATSDSVAGHRAGDDRRRRRHQLLHRRRRGDLGRHGRRHRVPRRCRGRCLRLRLGGQLRSRCHDARPRRALVHHGGRGDRAELRGDRRPAGRRAHPRRLGDRADGRRR